ncbi:single-stranded-DNA-specific exonuclease RecJ [Aurantibacillus circumpalustris]|uniref:single-stranded-DNA-specific exonuclease RecJ n=1 Tax=Aurantibacillus circumpalustris TaxID=3036359 RepID=UPI00295AE144|nr:single-stranded-DNA-specific exonuclease RecJ [Aurantibacillus circumpalustris]
MEKHWRIKSSEPNSESDDLQEKLNIDRVVARLLKLRHVLNYEEAKTFFRPELNQLHDPFLMKGMKEAIDRIDLAISKNEKVLIFGDYDVDGTTAVSVVYSFFKDFIKNIVYYIPDRYKEGYGISFKSIDFAEENNFSLIIALDCGIKAIDKVDYANKKNIEFIICDHHLPGNKLPEALAILDQKQHDCNYPYKELSGAGIGFKLIQAFSFRNNLPQENCYKYLDLVATSIAADIVPITGENRVMAYFGLEQINSNPRPGIKALLNINQQKNPANISTLVFTLGPRINAAGRIEHGSKAVELLTCEEDVQADVFALAINDTNSQRRDLDLGTTTEAYELLDNDPLTSAKRTTVLFNENWHKGVIGIVASRLIEKYYRPTIVLTESDGNVTGSARSVREYDVYSAIEKCSDLLEQFGGHKFAAGLSLKKENLEAFKTKFESVVSESITADQLIPKIEVDIELEFHEITDKLLRILKQFAPHGPENMTPLFCCRSVFDTGWGQVFGNNHLKLELFQKSNPNIRFQAIAFDKGDYVNFFQRKIPMDIVFKIQENEFKGNTTIQLVIEDLKVSE